MSQLTAIITDRARVLIDDPDTEDWSDDLLTLWYNDAVQAIMAARPDVRIDSNGNEILFVTASPGDLTQERLLDDKWLAAEAAYIAYRAFGDDTGDRRDADRSAEHEDDFKDFVATL